MIKARGKLENKTGMLKAIDKAIERSRGSRVTVGVHEDAGVYQAKGGEAPVSVYQVALWNEYGTRNMPARPFFRPAFLENRELIDQQCAECLRLMVFEGWTVERALSKLGLFVQLLIQNKIKSNPEPVLSGSWDEPDGHGSGYLGQKRRLGQGQNRLIATGLLLRSVKYQIFLSDEAKEEVEASIQEVARQSSADRRTEARANALAEKEANKARRAAHREDFAKHKAAVRARKAAHPGKETATRHANGRYKTREERKAWVEPKE